MPKDKITPGRFYFYNSKYALAYASFYGALFLLSLLLAYFAPFTLLLTVPFVIIPASFAFHIVIATLNTIHNYSLKFFFKNFKLYFSQEFFGCYSLIKGVFKSFLVYLAINGLVGGTHLYILLANDSAFMEIAKNATDVTNLTDYIYANSNYMLIINIYAAVSFIAFFIYLIHHLIINSFKISLNIHTAHPQPMISVNIFFKEAFKSFKNVFYKEYMKKMPIIYVLMLIFYAGGYLLNYYLIDINTEKCMVMGLVGSSLVFIYSYPYIVSLIEIILMKNYGAYLKATLIASKSLFAKIDPSKIKNEDELKELQKIENDLKKIAEEEEKRIAAELNKDKENSEDTNDNKEE